MRKIVACVVLLAAGSLGLAFRAAASGTGVTFVPEGEASWHDVPDRPGVKIAVLEGNPSKGPAHFLLKLPAGYVAAKHHHTADHYAVVLSGKLVVTIAEGPQLLPAGSYFSFTNQVKHAARCHLGADCVIFVDSRDKWDDVADAH